MHHYTLQTTWLPDTKTLLIALPFAVISSATPAVHLVFFVVANVQFWQSSSAGPDNHHRFATLHLAPGVESAVVALPVRSLVVVVVAPYFVVVVVDDTDLEEEEVARARQLVEPLAVMFAMSASNIDW